MRFIQTNEPGEDDFSKRLCEFVAKVKENEKFRKEFSDMNLHDFDIMTEAKEEGIAEGAQQKAVEAALVAIKDFGASPEVAAEKMGAPLDLVLEALEAQTTVSPAS